MTDLRIAAQQALEALDKLYLPGELERVNAAITALRAALAQQDEPVQEPVAWRFKAMIGLPWSLSDDGYYISCKRDQRYFVEALYTAPPQRKPLTNDRVWLEYMQLWPFRPNEEPTLAKDILRFARAIERAHGIEEQP